MHSFILNNVIDNWRKKSFCCRQKKKLSLISNLRNFGYIILLICYLNISNVHCSTESNVSYVDECRADCNRLQDPVACGKFRVVRWIHNLTITKDINYGSLRFVRLSSTEEESILPEHPMLRGFSESSKFLNFMLSSAQDMLTRRAFVYTVEQSSNARSLSSGPTILDTDEFDEFVEFGRSAEDRAGLHRKKKKLSIILPLISLIKLFKIKLMIIPILIGIHFIKKILLIGGLAIASIISNLKYCKVTPPNHHHPVAYSTWATAADTPVDFPTAPAHGHEDEGWSQKIDTVAGYDPLLLSAQRNAYRAYYQTLKQQQQQQQLHNMI